MGPIEHNSTVQLISSLSRTCLRKGCGQTFLPRCWNQRYCQSSDCLREVRRWQAAKRQRVARQSAENRKRHALAEARRRRAKKEAAIAAENSSKDGSSDSGQGPSSEPFQDGAWSRSKRFPEDFCDRPGCYQPLPRDSRAPARYCGGDCRQAMRRVRDRERKWLTRNRDASPTRRRRRTSLARTNDPLQEPMRDRWPAGRERAPLPGPSSCVGDYRDGNSQDLSSSAHDHPSWRLDEDDHSKTNPRYRSRPPPTD